MSTRAVYTFKDQDTSINVYKHHDGYPTGAAQWLNAALLFAWPLPRYEADEFAAAFVAANNIPDWLREPLPEFVASLRKAKRLPAFREVSKTIKVSIPSWQIGPDSYAQGGSIRLMPPGDREVIRSFASDIEYRYEIYVGNDGGLRVAAFTTSYWDSIEENKIIDCRFEEFTAQAKAWEKQKVEA